MISLGVKYSETVEKLRSNVNDGWSPPEREAIKHSPPFPKGEPSARRDSNRPPPRRAPRRGEGSASVS